MSLEGYIITGMVGVVVAYIGYLGVRDQNRTAKLGSDSSTQTAAQAQVLAAWRELVQPMRDELKLARQEINDLRTTQVAHEKKLSALTSEVHRWQTVAKTLARWGITMRDQLRAMGQDVPAEPDELMSLRIVSDADDLNP